MCPGCRVNKREKSHGTFFFPEERGWKVSQRGMSPWKVKSQIDRPVRISLLAIILQGTGHHRIESSRAGTDLDQDTGLILLCVLSEKLRKGCSGKILEVVGGEFRKPC